MGNDPNVPANCKQIMEQIGFALQKDFFEDKWRFFS
jgi:hypothetical protein